MKKNITRIDEASRITWVGLYANLALTAFKFFAGIMGKSSAMVADAIHSLSDFVTDIILLLGFEVVKKPVDKDHDYGHGKFETLTATIMGFSLVGVGITIFWTGIRKVLLTWHGEVLNQPGWIAFAAAVLSIIVKEWLYHYTIRVGNRIDSPAVIANAWEHRSDALASVAAMLGIGGAIVFGEQWRILDPVAAIIVSFFVLKIAFTISWGSINELLEASLSDETEKEILKIVRSASGALRPHDLKTRKIGNNIAIDIHVQVDKHLSIVQAHDIATDVENRLKGTFGKGTFISVHIEPCDEKRA